MTFSFIYCIMSLREKGTIEREVVMVIRTSKILMVIATVFTFLGVVLEILLHSNQQKFFTLFTEEFSWMSRWFIP